MAKFPSSVLRKHASTLLDSPPSTSSSSKIPSQRHSTLTKVPFYQKKKQASTSDAAVILPITTSEQLVLYTDGAAKGNGKTYARAGYGIYYGDEDPCNVSARVPLIMPQTNQVAELLAATVAMELCITAKERRKIIIVTDSMYVINGITSWILGWKRNNWKTSAGKDVLHQSLWQRLDKAEKQMSNVQYIHVRGHQGIYGNEAADQLAVRGSLLDK